MPVFRWINHQFASGKTFSVIVVGISFQIQGQSLWNKGAEALPAGTFAVHCQRVFRQSVFMLSCDFRTENRSKGSVRVAHFHGHRGFLSLFQSRPQLFQQYLFIQSLLKLEVISLIRLENHLVFVLQIRVFQNRA